MTINTALLVAAPMMVNYFVDKVTGLPLAGGYVSLFKNNNHQEYKNWYMQVNQGGNYVFEPLANPLQLSASGTIVDTFGKVVVPYYYPYNEDDDSALPAEETYFISVKNVQNQEQFTLENFPPLPGTPTISDVPTHQNYIVNNRFWYNSGNGQPLTLTDDTNRMVCPSQHDTFRYSDIRFRKSVTGSVETCTFQKFAAGEVSFSNAVTPEYYIEHHCVTPTSGETYKMYQFPISLHIQTLESQLATFTFFGSNLSPVDDATVKVYILQDLGTGITDATPLFKQTYNLTSQWSQYTVSFSFPTAVGANPSAVGDDALYVQIWLPLDSAFDLGIALPSLYLGTELPTNEFVTYDMIDSIIFTPRTGFLRFDSNVFGTEGNNTFGWVAANGQNIGSSGSSATSKGTQLWPLYNLFWNNYSQAVIPVNGTRGGSAYADFIANKYMTIPNLCGRSPMVANASVPPAGMAFTVAGSGDNFILTDYTGFETGSPVHLVGGSLPTPFSTVPTYFVINNTTSLELAETIEDAINNVPISTTSAGSGTIISATLFEGGEAKHTQTIPEMPSHNHTFRATEDGSQGGTPSQYLRQDAGGGLAPLPGAGYSIQEAIGTTDDTGGGDPFNVIHPVFYINAFFKL